MFLVRESVLIHAPIERVFHLSTRIELVRETLGMNLVGGVTTGHIAAGSRVVWRGWKFGLPTEHHTLITAFIPPHEHLLRVDHHAITTEAFFQDTQERGRFAFFQHDHHFYESNDPATGAPITELSEEVRFSLPFGVLGPHRRSTPARTPRAQTLPPTLRAHQVSRRRRRLAALH